mmetsp:Transcript_6524/g.15955  ORF Transcript_6524/g.15955 Transcript_6524/m.15955 type:complete len:755 (+) Transcript_6524:86-2350(+)
MIWHLVGVAQLLCGLAQADTDSTRTLGGYAASFAVAALSDVDALEKQVLAAEKNASSSGSALDIDMALHKELSLLFDSALASLRFGSAAVAAMEGASLLDAQSASFVEQQVLALLAANPTHSPLYFWHGPRRMLLPRLRHLLASGAMWDYLTDMASKARASGASADLLGGADCGQASGIDVERVSLRSASTGSLPRLGFAVGAACGAGEECRVWPALQAAAKVGGSAHLLLRPTGEQGPADFKLFMNVRSQLDQGPSSGSRVPLYISIAIAPKWIQHGLNLTNVVQQLVDTLGKDKVDLLWLPYSAFTKRQWSRTMRDLEALTALKLMDGYGLDGQILSKSALTSVLTKDPAPKAWLTPHDVLRPLTTVAKELAEASGVDIVTVPRSPMPQVARDFVAPLCGSSVVEQEGTMLLATLKDGLKAVLEGPSSEDAESVIQKALEAKLDKCGLGYIQTLSAFTSLKSTQQEVNITHPLASLLSPSVLGQSKASSERLLMEGSKPKTSVSKDGADFEPGIRSSWLEDLSRQKKEFDENYFVLYRENFFDDATFSAIRQEASRLWKSRDMEANCNLDGRNRAGGYILDASDVRTSLYHLVYANEPFRQWLSTVNGEGEMWPSDFPIELREYGLNSKGMVCHSDLQMYAVAKHDMEFVVTIDNDSKCNVSYTNREGVQKTVHTEANSVMIVRPNAAVHCVSDTLGGSRTILKGIYVGDYRKSTDFGLYTENECDESNPNRQLVKSRREGSDGHHDSSLEL